MPVSAPIGRLVAAWSLTFDELLKQRPKDFHQSFGFGFGQSREANHLPHHLKARDEGKHHGGALRRRISAQSCSHHSLMVFFDLLAPDFRRPLAERRVECDQETVERNDVLGTRNCARVALHGVVEFLRAAAQGGAMRIRALR
jgi:hypothetical protein